MICWPAELSGSRRLKGGLVSSAVKRVRQNLPWTAYPPVRLRGMIDSHPNNGGTDASDKDFQRG